MKRHPSSTVLGLTLDSGILTAVELKRSNGALRVLKQVKAPLTLNPLRDEPELVGREIRNLLNQSHVSAKQCVVAVPAHWLMTVHVQLPALEEQDLADFLQIEAERGFPCHVDELQTSYQVYESKGGRYASIIGAPRAYLERLEAVLAAAQLKPVSLSIGIAALPEAQTGSVTVEIADARIDLLLGTPAGIVALRTIESAFDSEGAERRVQAEVLARELRITLGQLPSDVRETIRHLNIFGDERFAEQLLRDFQTRARVLGLEARHLTKYGGSDHGLKLEDSIQVSAAASLAAQFLSGAAQRFEFLPPKPTFWEGLSTKYSSRRLAYAGAAAAVVLLAVASIFLYQQAQFSKYGAQWAGMKGKVFELEELQKNVRRFRLWQDTSPTTLNIMRKLTDAFPEEGTVSAKIIEIRSGAAISCIGSARDNSSLLKTIDRLRGTDQVRDLRVDQIRGVSPLQFTFNFQWNESATHEN